MEKIAADYLRTNSLHPDNVSSRLGAYGRFHSILAAHKADAVTPRSKDEKKFLIREVLGHTFDDMRETPGLCAYDQKATLTSQ
ncbi:hypothetical protein [Arcanobacterium canis]